MTDSLPTTCQVPELWIVTSFTAVTNLIGDSCLSASLLLTSGERLRPLLGGDLVREGEWLCFAVLSEAPGAGWLGSLWRGEVLRFLMGLWGARLCGERFSFPDEASFDGDLAGLLSRSASPRFGLSRPDDLDLRPARSWVGLSSRCGDGRFSVRIPFCSPLQLEGELDFLVLSLDLSVLSECFLSFDRLLPRPRSFTPVSLVLLVILSCLDSLPGLSADLLRLRRLELLLLPSVESRLDFPLPPPLGDTGLPELPR